MFILHSTRKEETMSSLKKRTDEVVADKKLLKALTSYVEEGRDMLCVTIFDGKAEICTSPVCSCSLLESDL